MSQSRSRKITISVLAILTILLVGVAIFIALRVGLPDDTPVAGLCCEGGTCNDGWSFGPDSNHSFATCDARATQACAGRGGLRSGGGNCTTTTNQPPPPATTATSCIPNKSRGDLCSQACGVNACDGAGPLECRVCTINPNTFPPGTTCRFEKENIAVCMNGATDSGACGQIICTPTGTTTTSSSTNTTPPLTTITGGSQGSCTTGWNVYSCAGCNTGSGCQDGLLGSGVDLNTMLGLLAATPLCQTRQADCVGTSGSTLIFRTAQNCPVNQCNPTTSQGGSVVTSSSGGGGGTTTSGGGNPTTSVTTSVTSTAVSYQCTGMTRSPSGNPVAPSQVLTVQVTETKATRSSSSCVYITNPSGTQIAQSGTPTNITDGPNNSHTYTYTVSVPANAVDGNNYGIRYSQTCSFSALEAAPCTQSFNVLSSAQPQASISVVKTGASVCQVAGGATIDYTITATNNGSVAGTLNSVVDQLPPQVTRTNQISNITPGATSVTADTITWNGPITVNANSSVTFTYRLTFTQDDLNTFTTNSLTNSVTVTYGNENSTVTYTTSVIIACLPDTALFDSPVGIILVGLTLILLGVLVNRSGVVLSLFGLSARNSDATTGFVESLLNSSSSDSFSKKVVAQQEKKFKSRK